LVKDKFFEFKFSEKSFEDPDTTDTLTYTAFGMTKEIEFIP
jgi:hypothetical protein